MAGRAVAKHGVKRAGRFIEKVFGMPAQHHGARARLTGPSGAMPLGRTQMGRTEPMTALFTLHPEAVAIIRADSKPAVIAHLAQVFAGVYGLDAVLVRGAITAREALGSTGFGRGVAIPHARLPDLSRPVAAFLRLTAPVPFDAADDMPVDLVFGLLSPEAAGAAHLHALAAISRLMRDAAMRVALAQAPSDEALYGLITNVIDRDAA